jgi:hypothetical protein
VSTEDREQSESDRDRERIVSDGDRELSKILRPHGVQHTTSPFIYTPPSYGSSAPQFPTSLDNSPSAIPSQAKELQVAIGYLLYYERAVDARLLPATCALSSEQALLASDTMNRPDRLLGYAAAHPNGQKIFLASEMVLRLMSNVSYLSRPRAGSVTASFHYLVDHSNQAPLNHPISTHSTRIPVVCSFVTEAEYGGVFAAGRIAINERQILADMGYPQPLTPIYCDNEVAIGLASHSITLMSKSLDMHFHWLRDHVGQKQFRVIFVPGLQNVADFFTKALPVLRHWTLAPDDDTTLLHSTMHAVSLLYDAY